MPLFAPVNLEIGLLDAIIILSVAWLLSLPCQRILSRVWSTANPLTLKLTAALISLITTILLVYLLDALYLYIQMRNYHNP